MNDGLPDHPQEGITPQQYMAAQAINVLAELIYNRRLEIGEEACIDVTIAAIKRELGILD